MYLVLFGSMRVEKYEKLFRNRGGVKTIVVIYGIEVRRNDGRGMGTGVVWYSGLHTVQ